MQIIIKNFRPPSLNFIYRTLRGGRIYKQSRYRDVCAIIKKKLQDNNINIVLTPLILHIDVYLKGKRNIDIDNMIKWIDVLNGVVWGDDAQIIELRIKKHMNHDNNRVLLEIVDNDQPDIEIEI